MDIHRLKLQRPLTSGSDSDQEVVLYNIYNIFHIVGARLGSFCQGVGGETGREAEEGHSEAWQAAASPLRSVTQSDSQCYTIYFY